MQELVELYGYCRENGFCQCDGRNGCDDPAVNFPSLSLEQLAINKIKYNRRLASPSLTKEQKKCFTCVEAGQPCEFHLDAN